MNENPAYRAWLRQRFDLQNAIREATAFAVRGSPFREEEIQRVEIIWDRDASPAYRMSVIPREDKWN